MAGLQHDQIVMLDLATSPVTVTDWATTRYQQCAKVFDTYMRDIDISPQPHHRHVLLRRLPLLHPERDALYYRWFTPESGTLGVDAFVASGAPTAATDRGQRHDHDLGLPPTPPPPAPSRRPSDGLPSGTTAVLGGPAIDGQTWQSRGLLVLNLATRAPAFCEIVGW